MGQNPTRGTEVPLENRWLMDGYSRNMVTIGFEPSQDSPKTVSRAPGAKLLTHSKK